MARMGGAFLFNRRHALRVVSIALAMLVALTATAPAAAQGSPSGDRAALVALYNATDGPNWIRSDNWLSDVPIGEWFGVATDVDGRVTALDIFDNQLSGEIPPELGELANLTRLALSGNQLSGEMPPELGELANMAGRLRQPVARRDAAGAGRARQPDTPGPRL